MKGRQFREYIQRLEELRERRGDKGVIRSAYWVVFWGYVQILLVLAIAFVPMWLVIAMLGMMYLQIDFATGLATLLPLMLLIPLLIYIYQYQKRWGKEQKGFTELKQQDAPELYAVIADIQKRCKAPNIHRVYLYDDRNAAMMTRFRFGVLGGMRNELLIGLGLLQISTREEMKSVLAHELGHASGKHGKSQRWIQALAKSWSTLNEERTPVSYTGQLADVIGRRLHAHSLVISRYHEYEADRFEADYTSPEVAAQALFRMSYLQAAEAMLFLPAIFQLAETEEIPPDDLYARFDDFMTTLPIEGSHEIIMRSLRRRQTSPFDDHPALVDRLKNIGVELPEEAPKPIAEEDRATTFLKPEFFAKYRQRYCANWKNRNIADWRIDHENRKKARKRQDELNANVVLSEDERWEVLAHRCQTVSLAEQKRLYSEFLEEFPQHFRANLGLGYILAFEMDDNCIDKLKVACKSPNSASTEAYHCLATYYRSCGMRKELDDLDEELAKHSKTLSKARYERTVVFIKDTFSPHELKAKDLMGLRQILAHYPGVERGWLGKKSVEHLPDIPCFVLALDFNSSQTLEHRWLVCEDVQNHLSNYFLVLISENIFKSPRSSLKRTEGSLVWERPKS